jgi:hypothetical protein
VPSNSPLEMQLCAIQHKLHRHFETRSYLAEYPHHLGLLRFCFTCTLAMPTTSPRLYQAIAAR